MNASRVNPFRGSAADRRAPARLFGGAAAILSLVIALEAEAQEGPVRLLPPVSPGASRPALPPAAGPETGVERAAPPAALAGPEVRVDTLKTLDFDSAGTLTDAEGGLGVRMWQGTPRPLVESLLPKLPANVVSPAMRGLMRRLLLTPAAAPEGPSRGGSLIVERVRILVAMGDQAGVTALLEAIPGRANNPVLLRLETDVRFLGNDNARACSTAAGQVREGRDTYWLKAFSFCQALAGEVGKAQLASALLREMGEDDPVFAQIMDRFAGGAPVPLTSLRNPTPLHIAMARAANVQLPKDVLGASSPGVLRTISISPNAPIDVRLDAAERAEAAGALPTEALRQLYMGVSFTEQDLANPLSKAEAESGPLSRALLYRTAMIQSVPAAQAEPVAKALALARRGGRYASAVRVFLPVLKRIPATADLLWLAPEAARAALFAGDADAARGWFAVLRGAAHVDKDAALALASLVPLAKLAGSVEGQGFQAADLGKWWETVKDRENARALAETFFSLYDLMVEPVPAEAWDPLLQTAERTPVPVAGAALWARLESAARNRRVGETVLFALLALGEGGPTQADAFTLTRVLKALEAAGFKTEARAIAIEAAVALGL
ncbi:MAG: hypothetical protein IT564_02730 [Rhodospirillales bacterium]|nr:hypothetical protein [Rhodospirillales bacterium]